MEHPEDVAPAFHVNFLSKLPWLRIDDDLKKYEGTPLHAQEDLSDYDE